VEESFPDIPGYRVRSRIGEGGFAKVYCATQIKLKRDVALKVLDPLMSRDPSFCERFLNEGQDTAALSNHPDIVTVYDIDRVGEHYYIAMQYLPGPTLKALINDGKPYQHPLQIILPIANALAYAHSKGVVHRDVKPANILFNEAHEAVLSDFGIAKSVHRDSQLTVTGAVIGTASYMSPEQVRGLGTLDGRSDLYSLGVVLFQLLTRRLPYTADNAFALGLMHLNEPIPRLPESEAAFQPLIDRLMAKNPDDRYPDGYALIDDIEQHYIGKGARPEPMPKASSSKRRPLVLSGLAATLVLAIGAGGMIYLGGDANTVEADPDYGPVDPEQLASLQRIIETAEVLESVGRITTPPGANAVEAYTRVLDIDPSNETARKALERLLEP